MLTTREWLVSDRARPESRPGSSDSNTPAASVLQLLDTATLPSVSNPSIAVLPFSHIGPAESKYFSHGLSVNIHNNLTRYRDLFISGRSSCLALGKISNDIVEVSKNLGIQYLIHGSVRFRDNLIRVTAELIDSVTEAVLWSEQIEHGLRNLIGIEAEIARAIAGVLSVRIDNEQYERRKGLSPDQLSAYDLQVRGFRNLEQGGEDNYRQAQREFNRALKLDPDSAAACAGLSISYGCECYDFLADDYAKNLDRHLRFAEKAITLDESDSRGHYAMVCAQLLSGQFESADIHAMQAMELNPSEYHNICNRGFTLMSLNRVEQSVSCFSESLRRNPLAPNSCLTALGVIEYLQGNYEQSVNAFSRLPNNYLRRGCSLAAALAQLGYASEARAERLRFQKLIESRPGYTPGDSVEERRRLWNLVYPFLEQEKVDRLLEGLAKSGFSC